jgi:DNA-binding NarL/FixJ family response regulator
VTVRVLLVDDQALLRKGFRMILEAEQDIEVIGEAADGTTALELVQQLLPDVVLMDVRMPGMDGIEATTAIVSRVPSCRVLILTTFDLDEYAFAGLGAGASGFLLKDVSPLELVAAIHVVAEGDAVVAPRVTRRLLDTFAHQLPQAQGSGVPDDRAAELDRLTDREREVLIAVAEGLSNAEIAQRLFVSEATVKSHVGRILTKLDLRDRVQAAVLAFQVGLVKPG